MGTWDYGGTGSGLLLGYFIMLRIITVYMRNHGLGLGLAPIPPAKALYSSSCSHARVSREQLNVGKWREIFIFQVQNGGYPNVININI